MNKNFLEAFNWKKPIIGMLHLKGNTDEEIQKIILHGMHACAVTCSMWKTGHG